MSSARDFAGDYSPGGLTERAARRARARHAGRRSGISRRRWARVRRGYQPGQLDARLEWKIRHVDRAEFDARYAQQISTRPSRPSAAVQWERRREAVWQHCVSSEALVRARGQHIGTTRERRAIGLKQRGIDGRSKGDMKCVRTIYTYNQLLCAMGIAGFQHVRAPRGHRDYLRVEWRMHRRLGISLCRQPGGTGDSAKQRVPRRTSTPSIPPPAAADPDPPDKPAERPATDEEQLAAQVRFLEAQQRFGIGSADLINRKLMVARRQLSLLEGQDRERIASTTSEGFRCST